VEQHFNMLRMNIEQDQAVLSNVRLLPNDRTSVDLELRDTHMMGCIVMYITSTKVLRSQHTAIEIWGRGSRRNQEAET